MHRGEKPRVSKTMMLVLVLPAAVAALLAFAGTGSLPTFWVWPQVFYSYPAYVACSATPCGQPAVLVVAEAPPQTTADLDCTLSESDWCTSDAILRLTARDDRGVAVTYWNLDGAGWQVYSAPIKVAAEGEHELLYVSWDVTRRREAVRKLNFRLDKTAPAIAIDNPKNIRYWSNDKIQVEVAVGDALSGVSRTEIRLDGQPVVGGAKLKMKDLALGLHWLQVAAWDGAGNKSEAQVCFEVVPWPGGGVVISHAPQPWTVIWGR